MSLLVLEPASAASGNTTAQPCTAASIDPSRSAVVPTSPHRKRSSHDRSVSTGRQPSTHTAWPSADTRAKTSDRLTSLTSRSTAVVTLMPPTARAHTRSSRPPRTTDT